MFRGREQTHPERGEMLLMRLAEDVAELGTVEQAPQQDGRNMTMLLAPVKRRPQESEAGDGNGEAPRRPTAKRRPAQAEASSAASQDEEGRSATLRRPGGGITGPFFPIAKTAGPAPGVCPGQLAAAG